MFVRIRVIATGLAVLAGLTITTPAIASPGKPASPATTVAANRPTLVYRHLTLPHGVWAQVYSDGIAELFKPGGQSEFRHVPLLNLNPSGGTGPAGASELPQRGALIADLVQGGPQPYAPHEVVVIYRSTRAATMLLESLGADQPMFATATRTRLERMRATAQKQTRRTLLDFPAAVLLHLSKASVTTAVARLRANPDVQFAEPDWTVTTTDTPPVPVSASRHPRVAQDATTGVPPNYTLASSAQSLLNTPADNAVAAYAELAQHFGQLPGQGETITNVSLGTLDDASAATNPKDPCHFYASGYGPTTIVNNGQRYLDLPTMPLIPTYTANEYGVLDPTGETCGDDPQLTEVGLDFSMMSPLPDQLQRPGETGNGLTDLLGIAPGASYRLVVPQTPGGALTDVDAAFIGAATQDPAPDVITASLGFGLDQYGFSSRYLEDDPLTNAILFAITYSGIVVCVSAGDGLRTFTNAPVPPSGGAVATDVARNFNQVTSLGDVEMSSLPSRDLDSGAIDVGGTTLDDIFAAPPGNPANAATSYIHAYPATRYDGGRLYASGFGTRVNIAAPGDNVLSFEHAFGGAADAVTEVNEGGTSAAAPQVAAAAAIVLQVARLTGDGEFAHHPLAVRKFLIASGTPVGPVPESDLPVSVGPQLNIGRAVETLLARGGVQLQPGVARVAVEQRQQASALGGTIQTATDPANISLTGRLANAWTTIAPDWTGLGAQPVTYRLSGPQGQLATTPWARLQPSAILASAGLSLVSSTPQSVPLTYQAISGGQVIAQASITLTFGPCDGTVQSVQAPVAPPVVTGSVIPVQYNLTGLAGATDPVLVVSQPGRVDPVTGLYFRPSYTAPLTATTGTIDVPVSALDGAGIYGIGLQNAPGGWFSGNDSAFTFVRVSPAGDAQPAPPLLSAPGVFPGHFLEFSYHGAFHLSYDVSDVPGATGAIAEISAPGPTPTGNMNTFNNPNGSQRDANGHDSGSIAYLPLDATSGTVTLSSAQLGLDPTMYYTVRVLATANGAVTGEASGVSTLLENGVAASDSGSVTGGFGINPAGNDGLLTSTAGSVETFRQSDGTTNTVVSSTKHSYSTLGGGSDAVFAGDIGVYDDYNPATQTDTFPVLNPVASGSRDGSWNPPKSLGSLIVAAANTSTGQDAVLSYNKGLYVTPADFATGSTGTPVSLAPALSGMTSPVEGGFAENAGAGQAVAAIADAANLSAPGALVVTDLGTGQVSSLVAPVTGFGQGLAVNPVSDTAAEGSYSGIGLANLTTQAVTLAQPGGEVYQFPQEIDGTSDFLVEEVASPDSFGATPNNNTLSSIDVIDSSGNLLHRYEQFNFYVTYLSDAGDYLQVNPATSTAFALGPSGAQIYPFPYTTATSRH
jgi:hypothetical protein